MNPSASRVAWTLMYHGHTNVKLIDVGLNQWQKYELPSTRQISNRKKSNKNVHFTIRADADMIKAKLLQNYSRTVIVDARTPMEHMQARIPCSILDNWEEGLGPNDETMKNKEELERDFEEKKKISKDKQIICYCHSGARASHKYLQFRLAGYNNVKVYDGSIIDWAQRHNPIKR
ncbi:MAG: hypothetical protein GEU26_18680 [Nitrososphaeraceae archaeon]|nr:hypothetical protein [Nitrososphaeraceae archaeon]